MQLLDTASMSFLLIESYFCYSFFICFLAEACYFSFTKLVKSSAIFFQPYENQMR